MDPHRLFLIFLKTIAFDHHTLLDLILGTGAQEVKAWYILCILATGKQTLGEKLAITHVYTHTHSERGGGGEKERKSKSEKRTGMYVNIYVHPRGIKS